MKILLMDVNCKYSSTGKIVYDLYTQLNTNGHTAAIAYGRGELAQEKDIYRFAPKWEVYLHALLTRLTGYTGCFSRIATKRLFKYIDQFKPDVVHLNDMHGYFVNIIPLIEYLKEKNIRTVWTFHCEFMYTGKCGHSYECEKWKEECEDCPHLKDYPQSLFFDHTKKMFLKKRKSFEAFDNLVIVSPSKWLERRIQQSFLREKKIATIYNGIDTGIFHRRDATELRAKLGLKNEKVVLAVAPDLFSDRKGGKHVLQVAHKMKKENIKFVMVGVSDLNQKFEDNVMVTGLIKDQNLLAEYYSLADLFLICSVKETFSMTVAEALCCGTPVVGFKSGAPETIAIKHCSRFVEYGDMEALQDKVREMLGYGFDRDVIAREAQVLYSRERMMQSYLRLYRECNEGSVFN